MVILNKYSRKQKLWINPDSFKHRSKLNGHIIGSWSNSYYAEIKIAGKKIKTLKENVLSILAIPSSKTNS